MEFQKYSSLENTYRINEINSIRDEGLSGGEWVVQTKVHGANASFIYDGETMRYAKRTSFCTPEFFNFQVAIDKYEDSIKAMYDDLASNTSFKFTMHVYGELFGGVYPGLKGQYKAIQSGVFYTNEIEFYAFDIKIVSDNPEYSQVAGSYLLVDECNKLFEKHNLFYAKTIFRGTFDECLSYNNEYQDPISGWLGMPPLEVDNICEGNVIRPVIPQRLRCGSRVILKNKNEKWSEKKKKNSNSPESKKVEYSDEINAMLINIETYFVENRLRNVLSKMDRITQKDFGKLSGAFVQDAIQDFMKDYPAFANMDKADKKVISKAAGGFSASLIRSQFLNIIDGTF